MAPVAWRDLPDLRELKADPRVFAVLLGGVRSGPQAAEDLAADIAFWGERGYGMWTVRLESDRFVGLVGLMLRQDGRGIALRFALRPEWHGRGYASEAAGAALRFGHERGRLRRVVAVCRESNLGSRQVLGAIGMVECAAFDRQGLRMLEFESVRDDV